MGALVVQISKLVNDKFVFAFQFLYSHVKDLAESNGCLELLNNALFVKYMSDGKNETGKRNYGDIQATETAVSNEQFDMVSVQGSGCYQIRANHDALNEESSSNWDQLDSNKLIVVYKKANKHFIGKMCSETFEVTPLKILEGFVKEEMICRPIVADQKVFYALDTRIVSLNSCLRFKRFVHL